jgi:hypothetical protein
MIGPVYMAAATAFISTRAFAVHELPPTARRIAAKMVKLPKPWPQI